MGKGEIAPYEQFLLFPECFQKACFPGASKGVNVWEWVKQMLNFSKGTDKNQVWLKLLDLSMIGYKTLWEREKFLLQYVLLFFQLFPNYFLQRC